MICILIRTYADLTLFFVWGIRFVSVIVCITLCFYFFSSWGNVPLQSYWSLLWRCRLVVDTRWSNAWPGSGQVQDPKIESSLLLDAGEFGGSSSEWARWGWGAAFPIASRLLDTGKYQDNSPQPQSLFAPLTETVELGQPNPPITDVTRVSSTNECSILNTYCVIEYGILRRHRYDPTLDTF